METSLVLFLHLVVIICTAHAYNWDMLNLGGGGDDNAEEALIDHEDCPDSDFECTGSCEPTWRQVNPTLVSIDWTGLWPELENTECVEEVSIVPGDDSLDSHFEAVKENEHANVTVTPCNVQDIKVKLTLKTKKVLLSEIIDVTTYGQPVISDNAKDDIHVAYKKQDHSAKVRRLSREERPPDFTRVVVEGNYKTMGDNPGILLEDPEHPACRKVKAVTLLYKAETADQWKEVTLTIPEELPKIGMWEDEGKNNHKDAEVEVLEFCKSHQFKLRIEGTEGTEVVELELDTVGPAPVEDFGDEGVHKKQKFMVPPIVEDMIHFRPDGESDLVRWTQPACVDGYIIQWAQDVEADCLMDSDWEDEEYCYACGQECEDYGCDGCYNTKEEKEENVPEEDTEKEWEFDTILESCSQYMVSLTPVRHVAGDAKNGEPVFKKFYSHPNMKEPFQLDDFQVTALESSIDVSFDTTKYPCISRYGVDICQQDNETCHSHIIQLEEDDSTGSYTLANLPACTNYNVTVRPVLEGDDEGEMGEDLWNNQEEQVHTKTVKEAVKEVRVVSVSESSVIVTWRSVSCAQSYELLVMKALPGQQIVEGSGSSGSSQDISFDDEDPNEELENSNDNKEEETTASSIEDSAEETTPESWWGKRKRRDVDQSLYENQKEGSADSEYEDDEDLSTTAMTEILGILKLDDHHDKEEAGVENLLDENRAVENDLEPCTQYDLRVQANFEDGTNLKSDATKFTTNCVTLDWKETVDIVVDKAPMMLSWKGNTDNTFNVSLECQNDQEDCNSIEEFFDENSEKYEVPIDSNCAQYSVKITKGGEESDVYQNDLVTMQNPHQPLELKDFQLEMKHTKYHLRPTQTEGSIKAYWKHTHPCISTYGIRLCRDAGNHCGDKNVEAPKINESIEIDLHMIPGVSKLEQCLPFQLYILPHNAFANFDPSYEGDLLWKQGFTKKFTYIPGIDPPRNPDDRKFILYNDMEWVPPNKCVLGHRINIYAIRHLFDIRLVKYPDGYKQQFGWNQTIDEPLVVSETINCTVNCTFWKKEEQEYTFADPDPCILYRVEIQSIYKDFYEGEILSEPFVQQFRTDYDESNIIPYTNQEVLTIPFQGNPRQIMFSFMNRCASKYYLSLCYFPDGCKNNQYTTYTIEQNEEAEKRHYYEQLVSFIAPCSVFKYHIMDGGNNETLIRDFLFSEMDPNADFEMKLKDYKIEINENSVNISWTHSQPCIDAYKIEVCPMECEIKEVTTTTTKKPWSFWDRRGRRDVDTQNSCSCWHGIFDIPEFESENDFLIDIDLLELSDFSVGFEECHPYEISVTPSMNNSLLDVSNKRPFHYYTKAEPPKSIDILDTTAHSFVVSWNNSHCSDGTEILVVRIPDASEESERTIEEIKLEKGENRYEVSGLSPCTDYLITLYGLHKGKRSEHPLIQLWITENEEDIPFQIDLTESAEMLLTLNKRYHTKCLSQCSIELCYADDTMAEETGITTEKSWGWWAKRRRVRRQAAETIKCRNSTVRPDEFCEASEAIENCLLNVTNVEEMKLECEDSNPDDCLYAAINLNETNREFIMESDSNEFDYRIICSNHDNHTIFESPTKRLRFSNDYATLKAYNITENTFKLHIASNYFEDVKDMPMEKNVSVTCSETDEDMQMSLTGTSADYKYINLKSGTEYSCQGVLVINQEIIVEMSKITVITLDGIPDPPTDLWIEHRTSESFGISWIKPKITNGDLEFYRISIKSDCENEGPSNCEPRSMNVVECKREEEVLVSSSEHSFQYNGPPGTKFTVDVAAKTKNPVFGAPSRHVIVTTVSLRPNKPKIVRIEETFTNSIIIEFEYPCPHTGPTQFTPHWDCYDCQYESKGQIIAGGSRFVQVRGLPGGSTYNMWIEAHVEGCEDDLNEGSGVENGNEVNKCSMKSDSMTKRIECNYRCKDGSCINRDIVKKPVECNWIKDCIDGSDEWNCTCDGFQCSNNFCIDESKRCNGIVDCNDATDEHNCPGCSYDQFTCKSKECIDKSLRCDKKKDCRDGSDELGCTYRRNICWPNKFKCFDGSCIPESKRCDRTPDCEQGEDEQSCELNCEMDQFTCRNGECISKTSFCNNDIDCSDQSDEPPHCHCYLINEYPCENGNQCVKRQQRCDGTNHCNDGSDERNCDRWTTRPTTQRTTTIDFSAYTGYPEYPYYSYVTPPTTEYNGYPEYPYINNDVNRHFSNTSQYNTNEIPQPSHANSGYPEYPYRNKEIDPRFPSKNQTMYYNANDLSHTSFEDQPNRGLVSMSHVRQTKHQNLPEQDRHPNSVIYNDIEHPKRHHKGGRHGAPQNMRRHHDQNQHGHHQRHNRKSHHQQNGSRHNQTSRQHQTTTPYTERQVDVKVYPQTQERKNREDVVIDCRDEGSLRLDVKWERVGAAMPARATQDRGRLEISSVTSSDAGEYVCKAEGHEFEQGGSVISSFTVTGY